MQFVLSKIVLIHLILLVLSINNPLLPQEWRLAKGTEGIHIAAMDIYYSNPDTLYAIGDKFLLSTDNGETWDSLCAGHFLYQICDTSCGPCTDIGALKIDPFDSKIIYVSHYGIDPESNDNSMTTDGGMTWRLLFNGLVIPTPFIEIDLVDKHTVYIVSGAEIIHRSSDHFQSWENIYPNIGLMTSFVIAPSDNNIFYAGYLSSIAKTTDKGKSWSKLPFPVQFRNGVTLEVDPKNPDLVYAALYSYGLPPGGMYKSVDGGQSWMEINQGLNNRNWAILTIVINPKNSDEIFIGMGSIENKFVFMSKDGGNNWNDFSIGLPDSGHVSSIIINNNKIYIGVNSFGPSGIYINDILTNISILENLPDKITLEQNFPNPFNPVTKIRYTIPQFSLVTIKVFDLLGREVATLVNKEQPPGNNEVVFNTGNLPSGIYIYSIKAGDYTACKKMNLVK